MKTFPSVQRLAEAIASGEIPTQLVSPGGAAVVLGITRQAVHQRVRRGTLRAYGTGDGVVLIDVRDLKLAKREKRAAQKVAELREKRRYGARTM